MGWLGIQWCICNWSLGGPSVQTDGQMARLPNPFPGPVASSAGRPGRKLKGLFHINIAKKPWTIEGLQFDKMCRTNLRPVQSWFKGRYKWFRYSRSLTLLTLSPAELYYLMVWARTGSHIYWQTPGQSTGLLKSSLTLHQMLRFVALSFIHRLVSSMIHGCTTLRTAQAPL